MQKDSLGDRMKHYELLNQRFLIPRLPVVCRLDGRSFHTFTKGLSRPYDPGFQKIMVQTAKKLVEESNAAIAYMQSDEITLTWWNTSPDSSPYFDGRVDKINSVLASMASVMFNSLIPVHLPEKLGRMPVFDCRTWNVPTPDEACNAILWREIDATKNSVSMAAQSMFSHKELQGKKRHEMMDMMMSKGVNWNDYPAAFKRGTYLRREVVEIPFTDAQKARMVAGTDENKSFYTRAHIVELEMPPITKVVNRVCVIFNGAEPLIELTSSHG